MSNSPSQTATHRFAAAAWLAGLAVFGLAVLAPIPAAATVVIPVQNRNDDGTGSLRDAIEFANNLAGNETVQIAFDLPAPLCSGTIDLQSPLPDLVADRIIAINGYSQSGSSINTLEDGNNAVICVRLSGGGSVSHALRVPAGSDSVVNVYGLDLTDFDGPAIDLADGFAHFIHGNRFGFLNSGDAAPNLYGVRVGAAVGVRIGWNESPALRNVFGGNALAAVLLEGSEFATVSNNYIGANPDGDEAIPNLTGVVVMDGAIDTLISDNVISGNTGNGILLLDPMTAGTNINGNRIGYRRAGLPGSSGLGNGGAGIRIDGAEDSVIGGNLRESRNLIGFNDGAGVFVQSGRRNRLWRNTTRGNSGLGIDLGAPGTNPNDDDSAPQPPDSANRELNFPILTGATGNPQDGGVSGTLTTTPGDYVIEFFATNTCAGGDREGLGYLGDIEITITQSPTGTAAFSASFTPKNPSGPCVIATATDAFGNTSEFSAGISYPTDVIFANGFDD